MEWICLICEKPVEIDPSTPSNDSRAHWPSIGGGTIQIDFGWFSKHDDLNISCTHKEWQTCICDDCFDKKKHICRHVKVTQQTTWQVIKEET